MGWNPFLEIPDYLELYTAKENPLLLPSFTSPVFAYSAHEDDTGLLWQDVAKTVPAAADNDPVYTLAQVSGFGAVDGVQATTANRALLRTGANGINGHNALSFDGANDDYTATGITAAAGPFTFYVVYDPASASGSLESLFSSLGTGSGTLRILPLTNTAGQVGWHDAGTWKSAANAALGAQIMCWALGSGTGTLYRNASSIGTAAYSNTNIGGAIKLFNREDGLGYQYTGKFGAMYCDNALHDAAKRAEMFAYLSQQWGIAVN